MRLSEAMRLGGTLHPQIRGELFKMVRAYDYLRELALERIIGTCTLGGALAAIGLEPITQDQNLGISALASIQGMPDDWLALLNTLVYELPDPVVARLPFTPVADAPVETVTIYLNDEYRWTREQIADWVECIENQLFPQPVELVSDQHEAEQLIAALASV
jgi:hypothetical protein